MLNDDTIVCDAGEGDIAVSDVLDGTGRARDRLDPDTILRVGDLGVGDDHVLDGVVVAAANGTNAEAVATGARPAREGDVGAGVDGEAVVLVLHIGAGDGDASGGANVESVGVVAESIAIAVESIARAIVDRNVLDT